MNPIYNFLYTVFCCPKKLCPKKKLQILPTLSNNNEPPFFLACAAEQVQKSQHSLQERISSFSKEELDILQNIFNSWNFDVNFSLFELLGCHLFYLLDSLQINKSEFILARDNLFKQWGIDLLSSKLAPYEQKFTTFYPDKLGNFRMQLLNFRDVLDKVFREQAFTSDQKSELDKVFSFLHKCIQNSSNGKILVFNHVYEFDGSFKKRDEASFEAYINDLVRYLDFMNYLFNHSGSPDALFNEISKKLRSLLLLLEEKPQKNVIKAAFIQLRNRIYKRLEDDDEKILKHAAKIKQQRDSHTLVASRIQKSYKETRDSLAVDAVFANTIYILEKNVIPQFFPHFVSKSSCLTRLILHTTGLLAIKESLSHAITPILLAKEDSTLEPLLQDIKKDLDSFILKEFEILPLENVISRMQHVDPLFLNQKVIIEFINMYGAVPRKDYIIEILFRVKQLHQKHLKQAKKVLLGRSKEQKVSAITQIQDHCFNQGLALCHYLMVLRDACKLLYFGENTEELFEGENFILPQEIIDYLSMEGLQDVLEDNSRKVKTYEKLREDDYPLTESSESEDESIIRIKEKTKGPIIPSLAPRKNEEVKEVKEEIKEKSTSILAKGDSRRIIKRKLRERGYLPAKKRGKGSHLFFKKPGAAPITLPRGGSSGLKKGTRHAISSSIS